jgi:hypothetical protein
MPSGIPIMILTIRGDDEQVFYRAYSPDQWLPPTNQGDEETDDDETSPLATFKNKIWTRLEYNPNGSDNTSNIGRVLETCTKYIDVPLADRHDVAYFFVKDNEYTDYKVIQTSHPFFFDFDVSESYVSGGIGECEPRTANHDFI